MPRSVRLVLCSPTGQVLGELPEFDVEPQWWPEVGPVVSGAYERYGARVCVLRLLHAEWPSGEMGGPVSYLAELVGPQLPDALQPSASADDPSVTGDHPLRAPWARPGGVADSVRWADERLDALGRPRTGPAAQVKCWNLSSILRLTTAGGTVWSKSTPPFFAHEGAVMSAIAAELPDLVPPLLAYDRPTSTVLLADVPGEDQWEAPVERLVEMVRRLVDLQVRWADRTAELLSLGLWDWRASGFAAQAADLLARPEVRDALTDAERAALDALVADLPRRLEALAACGLPETLVHGDFHPGNWRYGPTGLVLMDWGDSGVGHPMLDFAAFLPRLAPEAQPVVRQAWVDAWHASRPGSDPALAAELIGPVMAIRQAALYRAFLDHIEPAEHRYHEDDPARWLRLAVEARG